MAYYSCAQVEWAWLNFNGRIDVEERECVSFCCEPLQSRPGFALKNSGEETIEQFMRFRQEFMEESKNIGEERISEKRRFSAGCAECANFMLKDWYKKDGLIHLINLSMYPAPCQCKCIYCNLKDNAEFRIYSKQKHQKYFERMFAAIEYAKQNKLISDDVMWQISSGEITVNPFKERILSLIEDQSAVFYTNGFIFDNKIAESLSNNPMSAINLSIDSGTPQTWRKIKGVDNFDAVIENLKKYSDASSKPGQITLKYIVFPGINDNQDDYLGVIELMKTLKTSHLNISRDTQKKYSIDKKDREVLIKSVGRLVALLNENGMIFGMFPYTPKEREMIINYANEGCQ